MSNFDFASKTTFLNTAATHTIESGDNFRVWGIVLAETGGTTRTVTITDTDNTTLMSIRVTANTTVAIDIPFLADNGLKVVIPAADVTVTVFHSHPGS